MFIIVWSGLGALIVGSLVVSRRRRKARVAHLLEYASAEELGAFAAKNRLMSSGEIASAGVTQALGNAQSR